MSWFAVSAFLLVFLSALDQGTGNFLIGGQTYMSQRQQYAAIYVYDQSRGSPAPFNFTCTPGDVFDIDTNNARLAQLPLSGRTNVVDNVNITGTEQPLMLDFDPEFLPQFSGTYNCLGDGPNVRDSVIITTENPFMRVTSGPVILRGDVDMFNLTIMGSYTASGGVSERPTAGDYSLVYSLGGEPGNQQVAVQSFTPVMDTSPYEQVFSVALGQSIPNGTNFNLTLSVSGLSASTIFSVTVQNLPQLPDKIILEEGETLMINCTPTSNTTLQWAVDGMVLSEMGSVFVIDEALPSESGTYSCTAFGVTRQVPVYILPVTSNGIAIQYDGTFVPDEYVINNFEDTFTIICVGTEGNGQLSWFAETSGALEERFRNIRSQAGNYSGSFEFEGVQYAVSYSRNEARVTASMVMPTYTETFKCYSSESFRSRRVVTTTVDPYLVLDPSTPRNATLGEMVTIRYTVAAIDGTLNHTLNGSQIPNPVASASNAQLRQYGFTASSSDRGQYLLMLTSNTSMGQLVTVNVGFFLQIIVPTLTAQPSVVYVRDGDMVTLNCTPSDPRVPVTWFGGTFREMIIPSSAYRFSDTILRHSVSFAVRLPQWIPIADTGLNIPDPSLGLTQFTPTVQNDVRPQLSYTCTLMDGESRVNEQRIPFYTLRGPVQIIGDSPPPSIYYFNGAVVNSFESVSLTLRCVTLEGNERPVWSTDNALLAEFLQNSTTQISTIQINMTSITLEILNSREQVLQFSGSPFEAQFSGNYSCASQVSGQSANITLTTTEYASCTNGSDVTVLLGSTSFLVFRVAALGSDGSFQPSLTSFVPNFTPSSGSGRPRGYDELYHTHPNGIVFYFRIVQAEDDGEYRLSYPAGNATVAVRLNVDTSVTLTGNVTNVTTRELQGSVSFFCIPSDDRVQVQWQIFRVGSLEPEILSRPGLGFQTPPSLRISPSGRTVTLSYAIASDAGVYRCTVADDAELLVSPLDVNVTVLRRCEGSYAAGVTWGLTRGPVFEGEIERFPCTNGSSQFSRVVTMSRECGTNGQWSSVDFSSCTFSSADQPPFILIWLLLSTLFSVTENRALAAEITSGVTNSTGGIQLVDPVLEIFPLLTLLVRRGFGGDSDPTVPLLYSARIDEGDIADINMDAIRNYLNGLSTLQGYQVHFSGIHRGVAGFRVSDNCECRRHRFNTSGDGVQEICAETLSSPCNCTINSCRCLSPYVGNGSYCTLDSDRDGYPDMALRDCAESEREQSYCANDTCPTVFNLPQSDTTPCTPTVMEACRQERDTMYGIQWGNTLPGDTSVQSCGVNFTGNATRFCVRNDTWGRPDVSQCENIAFTAIRTRTSELISGGTIDVGAASGLVDQLVVITEPTQTSIFPQDLNTTNFVLTTVIDSLISNLNETGTANVLDSTGVVEVIDSILDEVNTPAFQDLQTAGQSVLNNAERYALYVANALSTNASEEGILLARGNIVVRSERVTVTNAPSSVIYPRQGDLDNFTISSGTSPAMIAIPAQLIAERANSLGTSVVPVATIIFRNLEAFLPSELNNLTTRPVSLIISSQVAIQSGVNMGSDALLDNPVTITFVVEGTTDQNYSCVFWNFSNPIGSGGWSTEGVTRVTVSQSENSTVVQCNSTHLTSFAVLVNVAGSQEINSVALSIISYIGLGISLACLLLTIIFFLSLGKKLFEAVHNFVHLNLAIALFLGYLTFAVGVELATPNKAACQAVTALLQYFLLAAFCWMLCEGIMLYLMLVVVFSSLSKKWWFFFILGWLPPVVFVVIGVTTVLEDYVVYLRDEDGEIITDDTGTAVISFCWLSSGFGTNAIWTFVAPMLAIVLVNTIFLILVLVNLCRSRGSRMSDMKEEGKRVDIVVTVVKASIILLPLLGVTWVLGLFAVNQNTVLFAWLFTIFNSLQGLFIFFFHVLRNERVWGRIKKKYSLYTSTHSKAGGKETASSSGGKKSSGVTNSSGGDSKVELKEKEATSYSFGTQFEPSDEPVKRPLDDNEGIVIVETALSAEKPAEEEVKDKSGPPSEQSKPDDTVETPGTTAIVVNEEYEPVKAKDEIKPTSDEPTSDRVETGTTDEAVATVVNMDYQSMEGAGHLGEDGAKQQPQLLKMRREDIGAGATVKRKQFHSELLQQRNQQLKSRIESLVGVALSGDTAESVRDDILLCRLMNKLHPGMIHTIHEETSADKQMHNIAEFITACKKLKIPEQKLCSAGDIIEGKNLDTVIACLEHLLESTSL